MLTVNQRFQIAQHVRITGCSVEKAAEKFGVSVEAVREACRENGVK